MCSEKTWEDRVLFKTFTATTALKKKISFSSHIFTYIHTLFVPKGLSRIKLQNKKRKKPNNYIKWKYLLYLLKAKTTFEKRFKTLEIFNRLLFNIYIKCFLTNWNKRSPNIWLFFTYYLAYLHIPSTPFAILVKNSLTRQSVLPND